MSAWGTLGESWMHSDRLHALSAWGCLQTTNEALVWPKIPFRTIQPYTKYASECPSTQAYMYVKNLLCKRKSNMQLLDQDCYAVGSISQYKLTDDDKFAISNSAICGVIRRF